MALPDISCSFTYFPSGSIQNVHSNNVRINFTAKGGGGWLFNTNRQRPFIPLIGLDTAAAPLNFTYASVANNIAFMPSIIINFFTAALNASTNYSTNNLAGADQLITPVESFGSYLYKRVNANAMMLSRYNYLATAIALFWTNANPAWTVIQMIQALNDFKVQLMQNLFDPNLYIAPNGYDFGAASVVTAPIGAFKAADANLTSFEGIEIYTP